MNRGARRLREVLHKRRSKDYRSTAKDLAAELGISESSLSRLLAGDRKPSLALANILKLELGIDQEDWADEKRAS